jgi:hypothetical protein
MVVVVHIIVVGLDVISRVWRIQAMPLGLLDGHLI